MPSRQLTTLGLIAAIIVSGIWLLTQSLPSHHRPEHSELDQGRLGLGLGLYSPPRKQSPSILDDTGPVRRRKNVAVASGFGPHFDVYMAFAKSLGDVMDEGSDAGEYTIHVFAQEFGFGFQEVSDELQLWKHRGVRGAFEELFDHLNANAGDRRIVEIPPRRPY